MSLPANSNDNKRRNSHDDSDTSDGDERPVRGKQPGNPKQHRRIEERRRKFEQKLLEELKSLVSSVQFGQTTAKLTQLNVLQIAKDLIEEIDTRNGNQQLLPSYLTAEEDQFLNFEVNNTFMFSVTIQDGIFRILNVNDSIERILDFKPEQWIDQDFLSFVHPNDAHLVRNQILSLFHQPAQKHTIKCQLARSDGSYAPILINGIVKKLDQQYRPVANNELGYLAFIGIAHLPLIDKYKEENVLLHKKPNIQVFLCRCSVNNWKIFLVDNSVTTLLSASFEQFSNRSVLEFINANDQAEVERALINACSTSSDDFITCQFIHAPIGIITMVLEIHPMMNTKRPDMSFVELRFTNVNDFIQNSPDAGDLSVLSNDLTLFK
ncbi:unnamed protein product [Adineta ricciae]|uniref:PAS domain-containing protein n=1 Tax=Adineta ricciae TaxID=249248 RepID=A0A814AC53_ADIRI|nr:unnamed protein product [Adineta ricciae]CAF0973763.1 unnamed protein product [Adineta ricciae]